MLVFVDSNGNPRPCNCIHLGAKMRCMEVTPGAYYIGVSGEDRERTVTVTVEKCITVSKSNTVEKSATREKRASGYDKNITVTKDRSVTRTKYHSVTKWLGTVSRVSGHGVDHRVSNIVTAYKYV